MSLTLDPGQSASVASAVTSAIVWSGGTLEVLSGGLAYFTFLSGTEIVAAGGTASFTVAISNGAQTIEAGGFTTATQMHGYGTEEYVASGGAAEGTFIFLGTQVVAAGGTAIGTTVGEGAEQRILSGASVTGTTVSGTQSVASGGVVTGTVLAPGGTIAVGAGGLASSPVLGAGSATLEIAGGSAILSAPGAGTWDVRFANSGGTLAVGGAVLPSFIVSGFDASGPSQGDVIDLVALPFASGGTVTLGNGNLLSVTEGGSTDVLAFDPSQAFIGEVFQATSDGDGGTEVTLALGSFSFTVSARQTVDVTGTESGALVSGELDVLSGGTAVDNLVSGAIVVSAGGTASGNAITGSRYPSVLETVYAGGSAVGERIGGGDRQILSGGVAIDTLAQGSVTVAAGGTASGATLDGGTLWIDSGGVAIDTTVGTGATAVISTGGVGSGFALVSGGDETVPFPAGEIDIEGGTAILSAAGVSGGRIEFFNSITRFNGSYSTTSGANDGTLEIGGTVMPQVTIDGFDSGGPFRHDVIDLAAVPFAAGGTAALGSGNVLTVSEGGQSYDLTFDPYYTFSAGTTFDLASDGSGGTQITLAPVAVTVWNTLTYAASGILVWGGAVLVVASGGIARGAGVDGALLVATGGSAEAVVVGAGGIFAVSADGVGSVTALAGASGSKGPAVLEIAGGTAILTAAAAASGAVVFDNGISGGDGGTLEIVGSAMPTIAISGFDPRGGVQGDVIDLAALPFAGTAGATLGSGNVLTVSEGGQSDTLTLDPAESFAGDTFQASSDGHGGTMISLPFSGLVVSARQTVTLASAAGLGVVRARSELDVVGGGTATGGFVSGLLAVSAGGTAGGAEVSDGGGLVVAGGVASGDTIGSAGAETVSAGLALGEVVSGGTLTVGSGAVASDTTLDAGTLIVGPGGTAVSTVFGADAQFSVSAGGIASGITVLSGSPTLYLNAASAVLSGPAADGLTVGFADQRYVSGDPFDPDQPVGASTVDILGTVLPAATFERWGENDAIDLPDVPFDSAGFVPISGGIATVVEGGGTYHLALATDGGEVMASRDSAGGTVLDLNGGRDGQGGTEVAVACFVAGTRIATPAGAVAVERLRVGDRVLGPWGEAMPVRWLGHRVVDCARHPRPEDAWPVRVRAGAFQPGQPARDLLLSPDHAVFLTPPGRRPVLIPVRLLVNGSSVAQDRSRPRVGYWHVELDRHAVLLAEGLPCESYLDTGNRAAFVGGGPALELHPDFAFARWQAHACAEQVRGGPILDWARRWLASRQVEAAAPVSRPATASEAAEAG